ncbi:MAG: hypothetical protein R3324_15735 [Halobacteriales archaeon]|nr:hypothetical protein [Halobacteriales archaeon]
MLSTVLVTDPARSGKTTVLQRVRDRLEAPGYRSEEIYWDLPLERRPDPVGDRLEVGLPKRRIFGTFISLDSGIGLVMVRCLGADGKSY